MVPLVVAVEKTVKGHGMIEPGQKVVVALSGGPDSVSLLYLLHKLSTKLGFDVLACHFDHDLRSGSKDDADFAENLAKKLGVPITIKKWDAEKPASGLQEKARGARYGFFEKLVAEGYADLVATGHTKDDSVETSLMWMLRGAGPGGFGGIPPVRDFYIRPLIDTTKKELLAWLSKNDIPCRKDPTNESSKYLRNRIRQKIVPALLNEAPQAVETIARLARLSKATNDVVVELSRQKMADIADRIDQQIVVYKIDDLVKEPEAVRFELYRQAAVVTGLLASSLTLERIEEIDLLATEKKLGKAVELPGGYIAYADHEGLAIGRVTIDEESLTPTGFTTPCTITTAVGTLIIKPGREGGAVADRSKIPSGAKIRERLSGDYLVLPNGEGTKKLKKFLIDQKVPKSVRSKLPLLTNGAEVLFIPGLYISPCIKADEAAKEEVSFLW